MFKMFIYLLVFFVAVQINYCKIWGISQYGELDYKTIQEALSNSKVADGDTIQVMPGVYQGGFTVSKNVVIMGSGAQVTKINYGATGHAVVLNSGKMMWFEIWGADNGVSVGSAKLSNCIINGCGNVGITVSRYSEITNCISMNNKIGYWYNSSSYNGIIFNCIAYQNKEYNFDTYGGTFNINYSIGYTTEKGSQNFSSKVVFDTKTCYTTDPLFEAGTYFILSSSSPGKDTGTSGLKDPDDSISDIGYYGGPDAPTFPVVTKIKITPNADGTKLSIEAVGTSPY